MRKVLSFDAETNGLWGQPFAVAAIVYEAVTTPASTSTRQMSGAEMATKYGPTHNRERETIHLSFPEKTEWTETSRFIARLSDAVVTNDWVIENVLPTLADIAPTHETYEEMLRDFAAFYLENKENADVICHMGYIVEAHLLREMHSLGFIGDWDAPFPLYDVSGNLQSAGEDATSVDGYAKKHALQIADYGTTHNPLHDCEVAARVYIQILAGR